MRNFPGYFFPASKFGGLTKKPSTLSSLRAFKPKGFERGHGDCGENGIVDMGQRLRFGRLPPGSPDSLGRTCFQFRSATAMTFGEEGILRRDEKVGSGVNRDSASTVIGVSGCSQRAGSLSGFELHGCVINGCRPARHFADHSCTSFLVVRDEKNRKESGDQMNGPDPDDRNSCSGRKLPRFSPVFRSYSISRNWSLSYPGRCWAR